MSERIVATKVIPIASFTDQPCELLAVKVEPEHVKDLAGPFTVYQAIVPAGDVNMQMHKVAAMGTKLGAAHARFYFPELVDKVYRP